MKRVTVFLDQSVYHVLVWCSLMPRRNCMSKSEAVILLFITLLMMLLRSMRLSGLYHVSKMIQWMCRAFAVIIKLLHLFVWHVNVVHIYSVSLCPMCIFISLAGLYIHINWSKCCLCVSLDVNQSGTNHNHCTQSCMRRPTNELWSLTKCDVTKN